MMPHDLIYVTYVKNKTVYVKGITIIGFFTVNVISNHVQILIISKGLASKSSVTFLLIYIYMNSTMST